MDDTTRMHAQEFRDCMARLWWNYAAAADRFDVNERPVMRWAVEGQPHGGVPPPTAAWLRDLLHYLDTHPVPVPPRRD